MNEIMGRVVFYRVKETDLDGKVIHTDVRKVAVPSKNNQFILLYKPVRNEASFKYSSSEGKQVTIRVIDHIGRVIISKQQKAQTGDNQIRIQTNALVSGFYEVELRSNGEQHIVRMMKE